jgi:Flp pilus assembly protein TadG
MRDCRGSVLVEFAIVFPVILLVIIGGLDLGIAMVSDMRLEFATEAAARCFANGFPPINNPTCPTAAATAIYAAARMGISPSNFSVARTASDGCVTASYTYTPMFLPYAIPLGANACYPITII